MNEYQWHGPAMTMPTVPAPVTPPRSRPFAAVAASLATLLVPVASFLPLYTVSGTPLDEERIVFSITSWGADDPEADDGTLAITGPLLIVATVLLLAAAVLCAVAATRSATPGIRRVAGGAAVAGAAFITSGVWAIAAVVVAYAAAFNASRYEDTVQFEEGPGAGLWLLVAGAVVALVAMVFALRATRSASTTPTG
jgi:hypothetical protein